MAEKRVSVRLAAVGGQQVKAELRSLGAEGRAALEGIKTGAAPAEVGLDTVGNATARARLELEQLAARSAEAARSLNTTVAAATPMVAQINRVTGVTPAIGQTTAEFLRQGQALDDLRAKYNPVYGEIRRYRSAVSELKAAHLQGAISADEMSAAIARERRASLDSIVALKGRTTAITRLAGASRNAAFRTQQMFYQVNDIGVSLAGGMNHFVVMAQQGTQIAQIYGFGNGGVSAIFRDLGKLIGGVVTRFWPLLAVIGVASAAIAGMSHEINQVSDVTVSFGDTALAVWQVAADGLKSLLKPVIDAIAPWFASAWELVVTSTVDAGNSIIKGIRLSVLGIRTSVASIPDLFRAAFNGAVSHVLTKLHDMVWYVGNAIDGIAEKLNETFGTDLSTGTLSGTIDMLSEASGSYARAAAAARDRLSGRWEDARGQAEEIDASNPLGDFFDAVRQRAVQNALKRTAEEAEKTGGAGRAAAEQMVSTGNIGISVWESLRDKLAEYAKEARNTGDAIADRLVGAFASAEEAVGQFVKTGKVNFSELVTSMIADLAKLAARQYILGPLASGISGILGNAFGSAVTTSIRPQARPTSFAGGGHTGFGARSGGLDGRGGFLAMLHPQERVTDEYRSGGGRQAAMAPVTVNIATRDAPSFRQSRTQVAADIQRAVSMGRRVL